jgi:carbonic anhydrase/acetyltransferase-like protein (isoleucine patch superfamily)
LITHQGKSPRVHATAYVAPNAAVCGDVVIGAGSRILFGAQVIAEGGSIEIGAECIVMEKAVGCAIEDGVFVATGAAIFHGARLGTLRGRHGEDHPPSVRGSWLAC